MVCGDFTPIVFDAGTHSVRVGWSGHDQPKARGKGICSLDDEWMASGLDITDSLVYSKFVKADERFEHPVIATCPTSANADYKKEFYTHFMESAQVPAFFLGDTAVLSLYAAGRVSGVCLDMGASHTSVAHISGGVTVSNTDYRIGGNTVDAFIQTRIGGSTDHLEAVKIGACRCSLTMQTSARPARRRTPVGSPVGHSLASFKLPDGSEVDVGAIAETAVETLLGQEEGWLGPPGTCVVVTGGSSQFPGLSQRLELDSSVSIFPATQWAGFVGASILSSLSSFSALWVTRASYNENGIDRIVKLT